jgi:hypothetical protein
MSDTTKMQTVIVRERLTEVRVVTVRKLLSENKKLRRDLESMGRELATMRAANAELQARLTAQKNVGK